MAMKCDGVPEKPPCDAPKDVIAAWVLCTAKNKVDEGVDRETAVREAWRAYQDACSSCGCEEDK